MKINVLFEDNHILVIEKPVNVPVQEDDSHDPDVLNELKNWLKVTHQKPGNVYLGLVHRLDRPVGGVMVFAKTSKAAARLAKQVQDRTLDKTYVAITQNGPLKPTDHWMDYLVKNHKTNRVQVTSPSTKDAKKAILSYELLQQNDHLSFVKVHLETGRSHQIRVQFSSRNFPLWGDQRYNKQAKVGQQIALWAYQLSFDHPITKQRLTFEVKPPNVYPWEVFSSCYL